MTAQEPATSCAVTGGYRNEATSFSIEAAKATTPHHSHNRSSVRVVRESSEFAASVRCFSCHGPTGTIIMSAEAVKRWTALRCWASISAMNNEPLSIPKRVRFVELSEKVLRALADGDLAGGSAEAGVTLDEYFVCDRARWIFGCRADRLAEDPSAAPWLTRAAVSEPDGAVVGDAGFHGQDRGSPHTRERSSPVRSHSGAVRRWAGARSGSGRRLLRSQPSRRPPCRGTGPDTRRR